MQEARFMKELEPKVSFTILGTQSRSTPSVFFNSKFYRLKHRPIKTPPLQILLNNIPSKIICI